jgi:hypothetical protein
LAGCIHRNIRGEQFQIINHQSLMSCCCLYVIRIYLQHSSTHKAYTYYYQSITDSKNCHVGTISASRANFIQSCFSWTYTRYPYLIHGNLYFLPWFFLSNWKKDVNRKLHYHIYSNFKNVYLSTHPTCNPLTSMRTISTPAEDWAKEKNTRSLLFSLYIYVQA